MPSWRAGDRSIFCSGDAGARVGSSATRCETSRASRKAVCGRTRREVADKLTRVLRNVQQGATLPDERQTVSQFLTRWLDEKRTRLRPRAWTTYEQAVRLHLVPGIGKMALARLT